MKLAKRTFNFLGYVHSNIEAGQTHILHCYGFGNVSLVTRHRGRKFVTIKTHLKFTPPTTCSTTSTTCDDCISVPQGSGRVSVCCSFADSKPPPLPLQAEHDRILGSRLIAVEDYRTH